MHTVVIIPKVAAHASPWILIHPFIFFLTLFHSQPVYALTNTLPASYPIEH